MVSMRRIEQMRECATNKWGMALISIVIVFGPREEKEATLAFSLKISSVFLKTVRCADLKKKHT